MEEERQRKAEVLAAWRWQLKLLLQQKVAVQNTQEEEAWRMSELRSAEALGSSIQGYRKGKTPEKHMCVHCLCKGIECEWDVGG